MSQDSYYYKTINGVKKTIHRHVTQEHLGREWNLSSMFISLMETKKIIKSTT